MSLLLPLIVALAGATQVAEQPAALPGAPPGAKDTWVEVSAAVTASVKCDWPGLTAGVAVGRTNGDVFMAVSGQGIWKSADRGVTFTRVSGTAVGGRSESGFGLNADPAGRRLACFMLDGASALTLDGGRTWEPMTQNGRGWDYAAIDWSAKRPLTIYASLHESGGKSCVSDDGGKVWRTLPQDPQITDGLSYGVGVVDARTLVRWRKGCGMERSSDLGATWTRVSDEEPASHVMVVFRGVCYWVGKQGLVASKDGGRTWRRQGSPIDAAWGPYFGRDARHVVVAASSGIYETADGGGTWRRAADLPQPLQESYQPGWFLNVAFDPEHNVFYASRMGKPTFRYERSSNTSVPAH